MEGLIELFCRLKIRNTEGLDDEMTALAFPADGTRFAATLNDRTGRLQPLQTC